MPYRTIGGETLERARSTGHVPIVDNPFIQDRLRGYKVTTPPANATVAAPLLVPAAKLGTPNGSRRWTMSFDGSPDEVAVNQVHPSTRVGYVQVAGVLVDLDRMLAEGKSHLVDPGVIRAATTEALHSVVMPGTNVHRPDMLNVCDSWRADVYEIFRDYLVEDLSLLDILFELLPHSDEKWTKDVGPRLHECTSWATPDCDQGEVSLGRDPTPCPKCDQMLFPTDVLRIHEEVTEEHSNQTALGRLMLTMELIVMVGYLHFLERRRPSSLGNIAFVVDGPLAVFGPPAPLKTAVRRFIWAQRKALASRNLRAPIIVGLEKTGAFAEYGTAIRDAIPKGHLMMLPDDYVYKHIVPSRQQTPTRYGKDTYYGQKFFYRANGGQLLTITVPLPEAEVKNLHDPAHYPDLADTLAFLDRIGTSLYQDANIPVALAHSYASIPLRTGSKVLTLLTRELLGAGQTQAT